ncbi:RES family NAD+ phosphorylase [soil metagenome]
MAKLPGPPSVETLRGVKPEIATLIAGSRIHRIYFRGGDYPATYASMRNYGPVATARFDHHAGPARVHENRGVLYAAVGADAIATCIAEVFQETRLVDLRRNDPWLACLKLPDSVDLLDLTGKLPTRAGTSANIGSGPRPRCRRWSQAIHEAYPDLQGLLYSSSMNGGEPAILLYERAFAGVPAAAQQVEPVFNRPLADPGLLIPLSRVAASLGYDLA